MNKRGYIKIGVIGIILLIIAISLMIIPNYVSAGKLEQEIIGNNTCEQLTDSVVWSAVATKAGPVSTYFNWTMGNECPGIKNCDIANISSYFRSVWPGGADDTSSLGDAYAQLANSTETDLGVWTRYFGYLNKSTMLSGEIFGPYWQCGALTGPSTCNVRGQGFNDSSRNYAVKVYSFGEGGSVKAGYVTDVFNVRYDWCWTPIIYDATVSPESADYEQTFTFTINVTNPGATTTVYLWTRPVGGTWVQEGSSQECINCAQTKKTFTVSDFSAGDIGNREFKFNATDGTYSTEAWASGTINECLDAGNDCVFTVTDVTVAEGTPVLANEKVNGQTSGATAGWGTNWTFAVDVNNPADGAGDIALNFSVNTGIGFVLRETETCSSPCSTPQTFTFYIDNFTCSDISPTANSAQYKFTATNLNDTSSVTQTFTIDKDNIQFIYEQGNNSIANRSGEQTTTFILRVNDTDKAPSGAWVNATNITFSVQRNSLAYHTDSNFVVLTNETGHAKFDFNATCEGEYTGAPKFLVGAQKWKAETLSTNQCYKAVTTEEFNTSVQGDIVLDYVTPSEGEQIYQEGSVVFLGATTDDCTDALTATVVYESNTTDSGFLCNDTTQIGANAFRCSYPTDVSTKAGGYNTTMYATKADHYSNLEYKSAVDGWFTIALLRRLASQSVAPSSEYYYYPNWQFNVTATSGDDTPMNITLFLKKGSGEFTDCSTYGENPCINATTISCVNCQNLNVSWIKNFSSSDVGTWFYQIKMLDASTGDMITQTAGTDNFLVNAPTPEQINLFDKEQSPSTAQWGGTNVYWNITVNTTLTDTNVSVYLWNSKSTDGPWTQIGNGTWNNETGGNQIFNFSKQTSSSDIGTNYYFFNATDNDPVTPTSSSTIIYNYVITKDSISMIYSAGNDSISNRSGSQTTVLSFQAVNANGSEMGNFPIKYSVQRNSLNYYTDSNLVVLTNETGYANLDFDATCEAEYTGAPKFLVGSQQWKAELNDSLLDYYFNNDTSSFMTATTSVQGDIVLDFTTPDGSDPEVIQEESINFLGATTDDCGDALVTTVVYTANSSEYSFECPVITPPIGANAFQCAYPTTLATTRGWYNATMIANKSLHYDNQISNTGEPGLFEIVAKKKFVNPLAIPNVSGWGKPNWNFSVVASSGDPDNILQVDLYMAKSVNPTTKCSDLSPACVAQTEIICDNCDSMPVSYFKNFTADDKGTWYFQFKFNDTALTGTSGTDYYITIEKDAVNISYGDSGNSTTPVAVDSASTNLAVRVFDTDKNSYDVTNPNATVTFKLLKPGSYDQGEKIIGTSTTNSTGYAVFNFTPLCEEGYDDGTQNWIGEILSNEPNYKANISQNFTINLDTSLCEAGIFIYSILNPTETFENMNFTINATLTSSSGNSENVNATLIVPDEWDVYPNRSQFFGTINDGTSVFVSWIVTPTTYGSFNATIYANTTNAGDKTESSEYFTVHKESLKGTAGSPGFPVTISAGKSEIIKWDCDIGNYRVAELNIETNTSGNLVPIRVETYDGLNFVDILHSYYISSSGAGDFRVPVLTSQLNADENSSCTIRISNRGTESINVSDVALNAYYDEVVGVRGIHTHIIEESEETHGLETSDELFYVHVVVENSVNESYLINVTLDITDSSGASVNSSTNTGINIGALSEISTFFYNISTSGWSVGNYTLEATITGDFETGKNRTEILIFEDIEIHAQNNDYMCSSTTEEFEVTIYHPFTDEIEYNVSLELPGGWAYSGSQLINISTRGNQTLTFNITSSESGEGTAIINATTNYTYPGINKLKKTNYSIEEGSAIPILEVVRETPMVVGTDTEFISKLAIYNKGCADADTISLTEKIGSGWIAYTPSIDNVLGGVADIPRGQIRYTTIDLGTIRAKEYKVLSYYLLSPSELDETGTLRYNLSWDSRNDYETSDFEINTFDYVNESRLSYSISTLNSFKHRSAEANDDILYEFSVTNVGDLNIANATWNISLSIPSDCEVSNFTGSFDETTRKIIWNLEELNASDTNTFTFNLNCTEQGRYLLKAEGINDTRASLLVSNENVGIGCAGASCETDTPFTFTEPQELRYKEHAQIDMKIFYNWTGYRITIGKGHVGLHDVFGNELIQWQEYSLNSSESSGEVWMNYTLDESEKDNFQTGIGNFSYDLHVYSYVDATSNPIGNVTVVEISNVWDYGKLFNETYELFIDIHPFIFDLPTPTLQTPLNNSLQAATPVGLSWEAISAPEGITISYYVYGDNVNASTLLETTTENLYLWRDLGALQGTFYWKIIATDGTSNTTSETRQFSLDSCQPNPTYSYALNYPMSYDEATDTITVWGSDGTGFTSMGNNETSPIIFERIFEFGQAVRGICAVTKPASGTYAVSSRLELGNVTDILNTTFVRTIGESISFSKQVQLNFNATLISGRLTAGGSPQAGSTLSFSGLDATDNEEGQFYLKQGSKLRLYDTGVSHTIDANNSNPFRLYWNGDVIARASTLQNWYTIRFLGSNNDINNLILTNMGEGFFPATTQVGTLTNIKPSGIFTGGLMIEGNSNATITGLEIAEAENDILVINYNGTANLINPTLNFSNINWTGSGSGQINRKYDYTPTLTDSVGAVAPNTSIVLLDIRGDTIFNLFTDASGTIQKQTVTRSIYDYDFQSGDEKGPHTLYIKKYGKTFQTLAKQFSAATVETLQLANNPFVTEGKTEAQAKNISGIKYIAPIKVSYGQESNTSWTDTGQLKNYPITQSEFFAIFANGTKLAGGTDYTIDYETGAISNANFEGYNVIPVYSYGGNITLTTGTATINCISMSDLYDYMQANLSDILTTVDGTAYTSYVNLIIGNSTVGGCLLDSDASLEFEEGYTYSFDGVGGYIDLYGVTQGGGTGGGLPLNIRDSVGSQYNPGDSVEIYSYTFDSTGSPVDANINITIYYPNETIWVSGLSNKLGSGFFKFNSTLSASAPTGTYGIQIDATYQGNEIHDALVFKVEAAGGTGSAYPIIELQASSPIAILTSANIGALVKSSTGTPINCDDNLNITIRDIADGSIKDSGFMTNFSTGMYNYSWSTPENPSVFYVDASCSISGTDYAGFTLISTQAVGATAEVDYNAIALYVWNYTSRELTWYNQSVAENLQSCLQDGSCSDWWINTTFSNIQNTLNNVNNSVTNIYNDTQTLLNYFNCTEVNEVCTRLQNILNNATDTNLIVSYLNTTSIPDLQSSVDNIYTDTQWLYQNVATQTNTTEILNGINNLQTDITFIKNNMFYQGNATDAFLVDYLSTVFSEPGKKVELWVLTHDLLGNSKTVSEAVCDIQKDGEWIANATTTINSGSVYSYWNVSENIVSGAYYWDCTLTGSSVNLQVPFYISGSFAITSLTSSSPKYPNENAIVEATFASQNGSVEPDTINLTIWKPNYLTIWKTANKDNFNIKDNNIWYWAEMIEESPTTGTYYAHMEASYNGITDSRTTQFRIATGGPYMLVLECPSSSNVGESLNCNVIIRDEGEATTESTTTIWIDTNNNGVYDASEQEPKTSFSVMTQPQQNITQAVSLDVPSSHPTGLYVVRASTEYLNSGQPDSTASDSITLTSAGAPPAGPGGGGGGGGGGGAPITGAIVPTPSEEEEKVPGEEKEIPTSLFDINVEIPRQFQRVGPGDELSAEITLLRAEGIGKIDVLVEYIIKNKKGEEVLFMKETVAVETRTSFVKTFKIPEDKEPGVYTLYIKVIYNGETADSITSFTVGKKSFLKGEYIIIIIIIIIIMLLLFILHELRRLKKGLIHPINDKTLIKEKLVKIKFPSKPKSAIKKITRSDELKKLVEHVGKNI